jgi:PilZ domain
MDRPEEARKSPRHSCYGPIDFRIHNWHITGKVVNLCLDGCLIRPRQRYACSVGDTLDLRFEVNGLTFRAHCIVRWVGEDHMVGVQIQLLSERGRRQLKELVDQLASSHPQSPAGR